MGVATVAGGGAPGIVDKKNSQIFMSSKKENPFLHSTEDRIYFIFRQTYAS